MVNLNDSVVVNKLTRTARTVAGEYGMSDVADDFTQFMFEKYLGGRQGKVSQIFIDFIRHEFGDSRVGNNTFRFNQAVEWEESMDTEVIDQYNLDFDKIVDRFEGNERTILILFYQWGMTNKEISVVLGLTEGRITQIMQEMERKLKKRYGNA